MNAMLWVKSNRKKYSELDLTEIEEKTKNKTNKKKLLGVITRLKRLLKIKEPFLNGLEIGVGPFASSGHFGNMWSHLVMWKKMSKSSVLYNSNKRQIFHASTIVRCFYFFSMA